MANSTKIFLVAVFCILISASLSIYGVFSWLKSPSKTISEVKIPTPTEVVKPTEMVRVNPTSQLDLSTVDLQSAMEVLKNFNQYLNEGEYEKAAELFDWEGQGDLAVVFGKYYVAGDKSKILSNICKDQNFCLRFYRILKSRESKGDEYFFVVQYQTKDRQLFVNSVHVAGQFITNTDFVCQVKKVNGKFKVTSPPNFFTVEAD